MAKDDKDLIQLQLEKEIQIAPNGPQWMLIGLTNNANYHKDFIRWLARFKQENGYIPKIIKVNLNFLVKPLFRNVSKNSDGNVNGEIFIIIDAELIQKLQSRGQSQIVSKPNLFHGLGSKVVDGGGDFGIITMPIDTEEDFNRWLAQRQVLSQSLLGFVKNLKGAGLANYLKEVFANHNKIDFSKLPWIASMSALDENVFSGMLLKALEKVLGTDKNQDLYAIFSELSIDLVREGTQLLPNPLNPKRRVKVEGKNLKVIEVFRQVLNNVMVLFLDGYSSDQTSTLDNTNVLKHIADLTIKQNNPTQETINMQTDFVKRTGLPLFDSVDEFKKYLGYYSNDDYPADSDENKINTLTYWISLLMSLFTAGHETTGSAINAILFRITTNQQIYNNLVKEVRDPKKRIEPKDKIPDNIFNKYPYLVAVIAESFRLHSPTAFLIRNLLKDLKLEYNNASYTIGRGAFVIGYGLMANLMNTIAGTKDSAEFDPLRWGKFNENGDFEFDVSKIEVLKKLFTFGIDGDSRHCPGESTAWATIVMFFIEILKNFDLKNLINPDELKDASVFLPGNKGTLSALDPRLTKNITATPLEG